MMLATAISLAASAYLFVGLFVLARRKPGYRHLKHTISELGEMGAPDQRFVAFGFFLPIGVLLVIVAYLLQSASAPTSVLALCIAIGYIGAAVFPCDVGSPLSGSARQAAHNLAGAVEYIGGGSSLLFLAEPLGQSFKLAGLMVLGIAIGLSFISSNSIRGMIQRVAEICLFGGLSLAVWRAGMA